MLKEDILSSTIIVEDKNLDLTLRPKRFSDFIGQDRIKENLLIYIEAAKKRGEPLDHILFSGPPGLGKQRYRKLLPTKLIQQLKRRQVRSWINLRTLRVSCQTCSKEISFLSTKFTG